MYKLICFCLMITISMTMVVPGMVADVQAEQGFVSEAAYNNWMMHYYQKPDLSLVIPGILYYCESSFYEDINARNIMAAFYAAILKKQPKKLEDVYNVVSSLDGDEAKEFFLNVLWLMDTDESAVYTKKAGTDWLSARILETMDRMGKMSVVDPLTIPVSSVLHLDILWSIFFATGDDLPMEKIISALTYLQNDSQELKAIGESAQWSIRNNATFHKRIYEICQKELSHLDGPTQAVLDQILKDVVW